MRYNYPFTNSIVFTLVMLHRRCGHPPAGTGIRRTEGIELEKKRSEQEKADTVRDIARKLKASGVAPVVIADSLGLSEKEVNRL